MAVVADVSTWVAWFFSLAVAVQAIRRKRLRADFLHVHSIYGEQASARLALQAQRVDLVVRALWPVVIAAWLAALALVDHDAGWLALLVLIGFGMALTNLFGALVRSARLELPAGHLRPVMEVTVHEAEAGR